jgi:sugar/nucleoside kinase (ribokinase family)
LSQNQPLAECGRLGSIAAGEIISHFGGRPETPLKTLAGK